MIGLCLRIQNLYTNYQCRFNIHPIVKIVIRTIVSRLWRMGGFFGSVILLVVIRHIEFTFSQICGGTVCNLRFFFY